MKKKRKNSIWPIVVLLVIAVLALSLSAVLLLGGGTDSDWQEQYDLGRRYLEDGNYEEAILAFSAAIEIDPSRPEAYLGRGEAYMELGDYTAAMEDFEKALRRDPDNEEIAEKIEDLERKMEEETEPEPEPDYLGFLAGYPEYGFYALVDINGDGVSEIIAAEELFDHGGMYLTSGEYIDLYVYRDGGFVLGYEDFRSKYSYLSYDAENRWLAASIGGSGGSGMEFIYLDESLEVRTSSIESYSWGVDEAGNEIWTQYYNGEEVTEQTRGKYDQLYATWQESVTTDVAFTPVPVTAPGVQEAYCRSIPLGTKSWYDLNGDGITEEILVTVSDGQGRITVNSAVADVEFYVMEPTGYYTILNIYGDGRELLIGLSDFGPSDDPWTWVYAYGAGELICAGGFDDLIGQTKWDNYSAAVCNGDGSISATTRFDVLGSWFGDAEYEYVGNTLRDRTEFYRYHGYENQRSWAVTTIAPVTMYEDAGSFDNGMEIPAGTKIWLTGCTKESDNTYWAAFESDVFEETRWVYVTTSDWPQTVYTSRGYLSSEDVFDGFYFAG